MKATIAEPSALHVAALSLHALAAPDCEWVLHALTPAQREVLQPLLAELHQLGIPQDPGLVEGAVPKPTGSEGVLHDLDPQGVHRLAELLRAEPPGVAAALCAARAWPWRETLLSRLPAPHATEVRRLACRQGEAPALAGEVMTQVERMMGARNGARLRQSLWQRLGRKLGGWRMRP